MFILLTGRPGAGKSYYAVHYADKKRKEYEKIYTNINGHKYYDNIEGLNFNEIKKTITECWKIYIKQTKKIGEEDENIIDKEIINYLLEINFIKENPKYKEYIEKREKREKLNKTLKKILNTIIPIYGEAKYKPTLLIIDEASNYFGEEKEIDEILIWFIRYHRHLYIDTITISQDYQDIKIGYRRKMQYYIDAIPDDNKAIKNKFIYKKYKKTPYYKTNEMEEIKIPKEDKIFKIYESGDRVRSSNKFWKIIGSTIIGIIATIGIIYYIYYKYTNKKTIENKNNEQKKAINVYVKKEIKLKKEKWKKTKERVDPTEDIQEKVLIIAKCNNNICKIENTKLTTKSMLEIHKNEILNKYKSNGYWKYEILTNKIEIYRRKRNEKNNMDSINTFSTNESRNLKF